MRQSNSMKFEQIQEVFDRIKRTQSRLESLGGKGFEWSLEHPKFGLQEYSLNGLKSPEELKDDAENAFIWLWNIKDYVKKFAKSQNKSGNWVEEQINQSKYICLSADIANSLKHGGLDRSSRSGSLPALGNIQYKMPQGSISSIKFLANRVETNVSDPTKVEVIMDIYDNFKNVLGDAFMILDKSVVDWEKIIERSQA